MFGVDDDEIDDGFDDADADADMSNEPFLYEVACWLKGACRVIVLEKGFKCKDRTEWNAALERITHAKEMALSRSRLLVALRCIFCGLGTLYAASLRVLVRDSSSGGYVDDSYLYIN